ncbi:hypothetical protein LSAT2_009935 [Lamellibrachia satsuma]|nr:hypothetical protein LSAT2_009935 [Lamellibrachia satsuma]
MFWGPQPSQRIAPADMSVVVEIRLVKYVWTATTDWSFRAMRRLKKYLRSTVTTERLLGLVLTHVHEDMLDAERIVDEFSS